MLLVSAIVPVFNGARFLSAALESALAQSAQGLEIEVVIVDDGSNDGSFELASRYRDRHRGRVRVIRQERGGPASARNYGAREARGEWLAFLDSDDVWLPGKLERQLALAPPGTGLVYTDRVSFGYGQAMRRLSDDMDLPRGDVFERLLRQNFITASSVLMRNDSFQRLGGFCEYIHGAEDWDLWLRYAHDHPLELCPEVLTRYRRHPGGISSDPCALYLAQCKVLARALAMPRGRMVDRVALRGALGRVDLEGPSRRSSPAYLARAGLLRSLYEQRLMPGATHLRDSATRGLRWASASMFGERRGAHLLPSRASPGPVRLGPTAPVPVAASAMGAHARLEGRRSRA